MSNSIFPSGVDVFLDPGPNTPENAAQPHHLMHSVANDAIVAVEKALLQQFMAYSSVIVPDVSKGNVIVIGTLTGDLQISAAIHAASYSLPLVFVFTQDSAGNHSIVWDTSYVTTWGADQTPNNSSAIGFIYNSSSATWIPVHAFPDQISISSLSTLTVTGNITVIGSGFFDGTLNTAGISDTLGITTNQSLTAHGGLFVTAGGGSITGDLNVTGHINALGSNGKITAAQGLVASAGGASISGGVTVTSGGVSATGNITSGGSIIVSGTGSIGSDLTVGGAIRATSGVIEGNTFRNTSGNFLVDTLSNINGFSLNVGTGGVSSSGLISTSNSISCGGPISAGGTISTTGTITGTAITASGGGTISTSGVVTAGTLDATNINAQSITATTGAATINAGNLNLSGNLNGVSIYSTNFIGLGNTFPIWVFTGSANQELVTFSDVSGQTNMTFNSALPALAGGNTVNYQSGGSRQVGYISSTELHKLDIRDLEIAREDNPIFKSRPVNFTYNPEHVLNADSEKVEAGFIAEELGIVSDQMVNCDDEGHPNTLNTFGILSYLADAVIYLKSEIDALKK